MKPTTQINPSLQGASLWQLVSHLSLNYLSLGNQSENLNALKEILRLYSCYNRADAYQQIAGIKKMFCKNVMRHIGKEAWKGFCRGIEITLEFDERLYVGSSAFLMGAVLDQFFSLYASINTFTQLIVKSSQREGIWKTWQPTIGSQLLF